MFDIERYKIYTFCMKFEYDPNKSLSNKLKHGMDFEEAQALWEDPNAIRIPASSDVETRFAAVGLIDGRFWSAFFTYRDTTIRIISVRRSREKEIAKYEEELARRRA